MFLFNQSALTSGITDLPVGYGQLQITNVNGRYNVLYSAGTRMWSLTDNNLLKDKTVSNLVELACISSPTFTGTPKAPTASVGTNTTQIATTAFVLNTLKNKVSCTVNTSYITPRTLSIVPYGKILRFSIDATVTDITTGWHTIISGLPQIRENQHYQLLLINTNGDIEIRDGLFTNTVFNVYLESFDVGSRIIVNSMAHIA